MNKITLVITIILVAQIYTGCGSNNHIELWYGEHQKFGYKGNPQNVINILGSVTNRDSLIVLFFNLNNGVRRELSVGCDLRRLARPGDFNIEIDRKELNPGINELYIQAEFVSGENVSTTVSIEYKPGIIAQLPYRIDWSKISNIQDVAEIVDGYWQLTDDGVRTLEPYYDRVIAIGDTSWKDYEVFTKVIFHKMLPENPVHHRPPFSSHAHASLLLRWRGHMDDNKQPRVKWYPCGGLAMLRADAGQPGNRFIWHGGESGILIEEKDRRIIKIGVPYNLRAQVWSQRNLNTTYSIKIWKENNPEPTEWDLTAIDGQNDLKSGSLLLVAHHADVTFGNVEVRSLNSEKSDNNNN
jgi:hypothetical protein